ncbi:hypothetical protein C2I18_22760 [Paenibacillus sp. PK3_47]|uniref:GNAT family N-acetyltransferase n=1 Tax=Paenibacillus sp. PK3_47 TaxID=2072642 RepID=UPI00201D72B1|nr:GNAT family N-acetyltransferase [Paenibacillus sp. PK3_47]UQZ36102.1 hypothetical protein C2I18_22760 [Paenibacillus sp. PK3_47]
MIIKALEVSREEEFLAFCRKHRDQLDDSFLSEEELERFKADADNPTYIAVNSDGELAGAASLMLNDYSRRGRKARLRILYAEPEAAGVYQELLQAVLLHADGMDKLNIFVPTLNTELAGKLAGAGFEVERYSFLLVRGGQEVPEFVLPGGYEIRPFKRGVDEASWCEVRNAGFAKLKGSETPVTPEMVENMTAGADSIEGGMLLLYHGSRAVGVVRGSADEYKDRPLMNIGPLALLPEYQGKGLGRILLRAALHTARDNGYGGTILCVNAENDRAKALYISEGFNEVEAAACYRYVVPGAV